ncbi:MAG: TMEM14 family protein [Chthoniobacteraceae bacterium]
MIDLTRLFYFVFGLITLVGGVQAFLSVGSKASLIAGGISGILLLLAGWLVQTGKVMPGLILGLVITLGLAGRFLPKFFKDGSWWPAGVEGWLGAIGLILSVLALVKK